MHCWLLKCLLSALSLQLQLQEEVVVVVVEVQQLFALSDQSPLVLQSDVDRGVWFCGVMSELVVVPQLLI